jgi:hypothetical protein
MGPCFAHSQSLPLDQVMARLAAAPARRARFVEDKTFPQLTTPLRSDGMLAFRKPDHLEKDTTAPTPEKLVVDGGRLIIDQPGQPPRVVELGSEPAIRTLVDTIRAALSGDLATLRRSYDVTGSGTAADWQMVLHPRDPALAKLVREVQLAGGTDLRRVETITSDGATDTLTITPES